MDVARLARALPANPAVRRATAALLATGLAVYVVRALVHPFGSDLEPLLETPLYDALLVAGALVCLARLPSLRRNRLPWSLVSLALLLWATADVYSTTALDNMADAPYPSLADAGWLAIYPLCYVAVLLLASRRGGRVPAGVWLDGVITALAAAALTAALLFEPIVSAAVDGDAAAVIVNLAYPIGDLVLITLVTAVLGLTGWRPGRMWLLFGAGLVASGVADCLYLQRTANGSYVDGELLDVMWPLASILMAWAAWQPQRPRRLQLEGARLVVVPVTSALVGLGLLIYDHFDRLNTVALLLASAALGTAVLRMGFTFVVNARMLACSRAEAVTDALTGLGNRRALMSDLEHAMELADPEDVLILFDLDGFKRYNDTFGHPAGDGLLARLGGRLERSVRDAGRAYRMGGDEFCVLLHPEGRDRDALGAAAAAALTDSGRGFEIAASWGAVRPALEASTAAEALRIADQRMYEDKAGRSAERTSETRDVLMRILREREPALHEHTHHVAELARATGRRLGLTRGSLDEVARAAELHDIGKTAVPDAILDKPGPLDEDEWSFMRRHTLIGESILSAAPALVPIARLVRASHERFDGGGYPDGKAGAEIPLGARIVAVCDAYDAMTSDRAYRRAISGEAALAELRRASGTQFDPLVVEAFADVVAAAAAPAAAGPANVTRRAAPVAG